MENQQLISIIIPTCNRLQILKRTLHSLEKQTEGGQPFEVILIDDGSRDGTADYLKNASFSFPFHFFSQEHKGPAAARNAGLKTAGGKTVLFLNDDCLAAPDLLYQHRRFRQKHGECAVLGRIEWPPEVPLPPAVKELAYDYCFPYKKIINPAYVPFHYFITGNLSAPLPEVVAAGGFDEFFKDAACEDIELGYRLQHRGLRLRYNPASVAFHLHKLDFDQLCNRQLKAAYWFQAFAAKHPEATAHFQGVLACREEYPFLENKLENKKALKLILRYMMYRGSKAGKKDFFTKILSSS